MITLRQLFGSLPSLGALRELFPRDRDTFRTTGWHNMIGILTIMAAALLLLVACGGAGEQSELSAVQPTTLVPSLEVAATPSSATLPNTAVVSQSTLSPVITAVSPMTPPPSSAPSEPRSSQDGRPLIARVNGQPIYLDVYQKQVEQTEKALVEQGIMAQGEVGEAQRAQLRANVLQGLIDQALIEQAAAEMGVTVTDEELEQSLQSVVSQNATSLEQWLRMNNMTEEELRAMQRAQLLASKVIAVVSATVPTVAEQVHARHIFTVDQAKGQALLERLKKGENFAALAQQESEDASTAANGGDLGWFPRDVALMPPAVVETAFALSVGEISDLVQSEAGYHIIKVEAREDNRPLAPEMLLYAQQSAFQAWLAERRAHAVIEHYQSQ
ncbi:MAG: foldase protein PrsA [Anaerolineae bacterium]